MFNRLDVQFPSGGILCSAWLYLPGLPDQPEGQAPRPVIVMGHGVAGVREMRLDAYAERFCEEGYACLVFDYRHFGASQGEPRQLLDIQLQLEDWASAIRFARSRKDVDGKRIILWGSSFGGGHVLAAAAADRNIAAVVSQCPFTNGLSSGLALNIFSSLKVGILAFCDKIGSLLGMRPISVGVFGKSGAAALMTAFDAQDGYLNLMKEGVSFRNEVAARFGLDIIRYFPGRRTSGISCPVLFCICEKDSVAPAKATKRHAGKAPRGEIKLYPNGHFDIYIGSAFERVVADQIEFLQRQVPIDH